MSSHIILLIHRLSRSRPYIARSLFSFPLISSYIHIMPACPTISSSIHFIHATAVHGYIPLFLHVRYVYIPRRFLYILPSGSSPSHPHPHRRPAFVYHFHIHIPSCFLAHASATITSLRRYIPSTDACAPSHLHRGVIGRHPRCSVPVVCSSTIRFLHPLDSFRLAWLLPTTVRCLYRLI